MIFHVFNKTESRHALFSSVVWVGHTESSIISLVAGMFADVLFMLVFYYCVIGITYVDEFEVYWLMIA